MVKKTYNQPTCLVVTLSSRDAMLQSVSANNSTTGLEGTSYGGGSTSGGVTSGDVKGTSDVNVWDEEW